MSNGQQQESNPLAERYEELLKLHGGDEQAAQAEMNREFGVSGDAQPAPQPVAAPTTPEGVPLVGRRRLPSPQERYPGVDLDAADSEWLRRRLMDDVMKFLQESTKQHIPKGMLEIRARQLVALGIRNQIDPRDIVSMAGEDQGEREEPEFEEYEGVEFPKPSGFGALVPYHRPMHDKWNPGWGFIARIPENFLFSPMQRAVISGLDFFGLDKTAADMRAMNIIPAHSETDEIAQGIMQFVYGIWLTPGGKLGKGIRKAGGKAAEAMASNTGVGKVAQAVKKAGEGAQKLGQKTREVADKAKAAAGATKAGQKVKDISPIYLKAAKLGTRAYFADVIYGDEEAGRIIVRGARSLGGTLRESFSGVVFADDADLEDQQVGFLSRWAMNFAMEHQVPVSEAQARWAGLGGGGLVLGAVGAGAISGMASIGRNVWRKVMTRQMRRRFMEEALEKGFSQQTAEEYADYMASGMMVMQHAVGIRKLAKSRKEFDDFVRAELLEGQEGGPDAITRNHEYRRTSLNEANATRYRVETDQLVPHSDAAHRAPMGVPGPEAATNPHTASRRSLQLRPDVDEIAKNQSEFERTAQTLLDELEEARKDGNRVRVDEITMTLRRLDEQRVANRTPAQQFNREAQRKVNFEADMEDTRDLHAALELVRDLGPERVVDEAPPQPRPSRQAAEPEDMDEALDSLTDAERAEIEQPVTYKEMGEQPPDDAPATTPFKATPQRQDLELTPSAHVPARYTLSSRTKAAFKANQGAKLSLSELPEDVRRYVMIATQRGDIPKHRDSIWPVAMTEQQVLAAIERYGPDQGVTTGAIKPGKPARTGNLLKYEAEDIPETPKTPLDESDPAPPPAEPEAPVPEISSDPRQGAIDRYLNSIGKKWNEPSPVHKLVNSIEETEEAFGYEPGELWAILSARGLDLEGMKEAIYKGQVKMKPGSQQARDYAAKMRRKEEADKKAKAKEKAPPKKKAKAKKEKKPSMSDDMKSRMKHFLKTHFDEQDFREAVEHWNTLDMGKHREYMHQARLIVEGAERKPNVHLAKAYELAYRDAIGYGPARNEIDKVRLSLGSEFETLEREAYEKAVKEHKGDPDDIGEDQLFEIDMDKLSPMLRDAVEQARDSNIVTDRSYKEGMVTTWEIEQAAASYIPPKHKRNIKPAAGAGIVLAAGALGGGEDSEAQAAGLTGGLLKKALSRAAKDAAERAKSQGQKFLFRGEIGEPTDEVQAAFARLSGNKTEEKWNDAADLWSAFSDEHRAIAILDTYKAGVSSRPMRIHFSPDESERMFGVSQDQAARRVELERTEDMKTGKFNDDPDVQEEHEQQMRLFYMSQSQDDYITKNAPPSLIAEAMIAEVRLRDFSNWLDRGGKGPGPWKLGKGGKVTLLAGALVFVDSDEAEAGPSSVLARGLARLAQLTPAERATKAIYDQISWESVRVDFHDAKRAWDSLPPEDQATRLAQPVRAHVSQSRLDAVFEGTSESTPLGILGELRDGLEMPNATFPELREAYVRQMAEQLRERNRNNPRFHGQADEAFQARTREDLVDNFNRRVQRKMERMGHVFDTENERLAFNMMEYAYETKNAADRIFERLADQDGWYEGLTPSQQQIARDTFSTRAFLAMDELATINDVFLRESAGQGVHAVKQMRAIQHFEDEVELAIRVSNMGEAPSPLPRETPASRQPSPEEPEYPRDQSTPLRSAPRGEFDDVNTRLEQIDEELHGIFGRYDSEEDYAERATAAELEHTNNLLMEREQLTTGAEPSAPREQPVISGSTDEVLEQLRALLDEEGGDPPDSTTSGVAGGGLVVGAAAAGAPEEAEGANVAGVGGGIARLMRRLIDSASRKAPSEVSGLAAYPDTFLPATLPGVKEAFDAQLADLAPEYRAYAPTWADAKELWDRTKNTQRISAYRSATGKELERVENAEFSEIRRKMSSEAVNRSRLAGHRPLSKEADRAIQEDMRQQKLAYESENAISGFGIFAEKSADDPEGIAKAMIQNVVTWVRHLEREGAVASDPRKISGRTALGATAAAGFFATQEDAEAANLFGSGISSKLARNAVSFNPRQYWDGVGYPFNRTTHSTFKDMAGTEIEWSDGVMLWKEMSDKERKDWIVKANFGRTRLREPKTEEYNLTEREDMTLGRAMVLAAVDSRSQWDAFADELMQGQSIENAGLIRKLFVSEMMRDRSFSGARMRTAVARGEEDTMSAHMAKDRLNRLIGKFEPEEAAEEAGVPPTREAGEAAPAPREAQSPERKEEVPAPRETGSEEPPPTRTDAGDGASAYPLKELVDALRAHSTNDLEQSVALVKFVLGRQELPGIKDPGAMREALYMAIEKHIGVSPQSTNVRHWAQWLRRAYMHAMKDSVDYIEGGRGDIHGVIDEALRERVVFTEHSGIVKDRQKNAFIREVQGGNTQGWQSEPRDVVKTPIPATVMSGGKLGDGDLETGEFPMLWTIAFDKVRNARDALQEMHFARQKIREHLEQVAPPGVDVKKMSDREIDDLADAMVVTHLRSIASVHDRMRTRTTEEMLSRAMTVATGWRKARDAGRWLAETERLQKAIEAEKDGQVKEVLTARLNEAQKDATALFNEAEQDLGRYATYGSANYETMEKYYDLRIKDLDDQFEEMGLQEFRRNDNDMLPDGYDDEIERLKAYVKENEGGTGLLPGIAEQVKDAKTKRAMLIWQKRLLENREHVKEARLNALSRDEDRWRRASARRVAGGWRRLNEAARAIMRAEHPETIFDIANNRSMMRLSDVFLSKEIGDMLRNPATVLRNIMGITLTNPNLFLARMAGRVGQSATLQEKMFAAEMNSIAEGFYEMLYYVNSRRNDEGVKVAHPRLHANTQRVIGPTNREHLMMETADADKYETSYLSGFGRKVVFGKEDSALQNKLGDNENIQKALKHFMTWSRWPGELNIELDMIMKAGQNRRTLILEAHRRAYEEADMFGRGADPEWVAGRISELLGEGNTPIPRDLEMYALQKAREYTYTENMGVIADQIARFREISLITRLLMPFIAAPNGLLRYIAKETGLGLPFVPFERTGRTILRNGGPEAEEYYGRMMVAGARMIYGASLWSRGFLYAHSPRGESDRGIRDSFVQPYSLLMPDGTSKNLGRMSPVYAAELLGAAIMQMIHDLKLDEADSEKLFYSIMLSAGEFMDENAWFAPLLRAPAVATPAGGHEFSRMAQDIGQRFHPLNVLPGIGSARQVVETIIEPRMNYYKSFIHRGQFLDPLWRMLQEIHNKNGYTQFYNHVTGTMMPKKYHVFGEPNLKYREDENLLGITLNTMYPATRRVQPDKEVLEVARKLEREGVGIMPIKPIIQMPTNSEKYPWVDILLTPDQYEGYARDYGKMIRLQLITYEKAGLLAPGMPRELYQNRLGTITQLSRKYAGARLLERHGDAVYDEVLKATALAGERTITNQVGTYPRSSSTTEEALDRTQRETDALSDRLSPPAGP